MRITTYNELKNKVFTSVTVNDQYDEMVFVADNGEMYKFFHEQDCCEGVLIEDIVGNLDDLVGSPLLMAEEVVYEQENPESVNIPDINQDSFTWTFYKFATIKGYVTVRWYGESNGYYSESVDFRKLN